MAGMTPPEAEDALRLVVQVGPAKGLRVPVRRAQAGQRAIQAVQVTEAGLEPGMAGIRRQRPVELAVIAPFVPFAEFSAHEQELLARMEGHVRVQQPQVGELLPPVARHLAEQRTLAVHDLVVRQRQHEALRPGVHEREGDQPVLVPPVHRIEREVAQRVVHPAHVPLHRETEPALLRRAGDARECGRLLGNGQHAGIVVAHRGVELPQEVDGLEVLAPAVAVGHPFPLAPAVVEIQHGGDRVDPEPIDMIVLEPEHRVGDQEVAHLVAAVVEDLGAPVHVLAETRVLVLVQGRAVEMREAVVIAREMRRHPVDEHAKPRLVAAVDEVHEVGRGSVARRGRVVADDLVAP